MKTTLRILVLSISIMIISSCDKRDTAPELQNDSINKIMPLGASRVQGDRPNYESFRFELWKALVEDGWTFDFIGTQSDAAFYPAFEGENFDADHEGRSGWTSGFILNGLDIWLDQTGAPDIVLFSSPGGNDALQNASYTQTITNINAIIDTLQKLNPNITIIIEQLAPAHSDIMTEDLTNYLNNLHQDVLTIASEQSTSSSKVITVDMFTGFSDSMLADNSHYNDLGAKFIAKQYYNVLVDILEK